MRSILSAAAFVLLSSSAWGASAITDCDYRFEDVAEAWGDQGFPLVLIPSDRLGPLITKLEALTGDRYTSIKNAFLGESDGDVIVVLDLDGCVVQVELT